MPTTNVHLDFRGIKIGDYKVNGVNAETALSPDLLFKDHKVAIPSSLLKASEKNTLTLSILNKYRRDGVGLHSFTDKVDGLQYIYTQFEADFCHYVFPCFDQPDLKATWSFSAITDDDWNVISNEAEVKDDKEREESLEKETKAAAEIFKDSSDFAVV